MIIFAAIRRLEHFTAGLLPHWLGALALRLGLATPFLRSGLTRWDSFPHVNETDVLLFTDEFKLHILGGVYDYPFPTVMAYASALGETFLPILLIFGFFTRGAAIALLLMTALIQITVPTGWPIHITWAAMAAGIILLGGGRLSADHLTGGK